MSKWIAFLSDPTNQALLAMLTKHPRAHRDGSPYQVPMLMTDPERVPAVVIGSVQGAYDQKFIVVDPTGPLAWRELSKRIIRVIDQNSPRCVFVVCGIPADMVFPVVDTRHVVVRLSEPTITADDADTLIQAAANV